MIDCILLVVLSVLCIFFFLQWVPEITHHCPKTPFLLVGTQIDLRDDPSTVEKLAKNKQKPITPETAEKLARDLKAVKYVECSALTQVRFPMNRLWKLVWQVLVFKCQFPNECGNALPCILLTAFGLNLHLTLCCVPVFFLSFPLSVAGIEERIWWGYPSRFRAPRNSEKEKMLFVLMSSCILLCLLIICCLIIVKKCLSLQ